MEGRPAAGGGTWVTVAPARLSGWLDRFAGELLRSGSDEVVYEKAVVEVPFPPLAGDLVAHVLRERRVGVLLVRRGGYAAGVFEGSSLVASKVGTRLVQSRTAAGGWSQQRYARRRSNQADALVLSAASVAAGVLTGPLDAVVTGGDKALVAAVLAELDPLPVVPRVLEVPDPRLAVLEKVRFRDVWIRTP